MQNIETIGFIGLLLLFLWGTAKYGFQSALLSLLPSIPLGAGLSSLAVMMYCLQSGEGWCGIWSIYIFPFAVVFVYAVTLLKLYSTSIFKPFLGFVLGGTIVLVIFGEYHIYKITHFVTVSSTLVLITAIIGGFIGAYITTSKNNPLTEKFKHAYKGD